MGFSRLGTRHKCLHLMIIRLWFCCVAFEWSMLFFSMKYSFGLKGLFTHLRCLQKLLEYFSFTWGLCVSTIIVMPATAGLLVPL